MPQVTNAMLTRLKGDDNLVLAIAQGIHRRFNTVARWVASNDEMLGSKAVVLIIKEETGLSEEDFVEPEKVNAIQ